VKVNVCVNGTFRYPQYIRHYDAAGELGAFYFAHRPSMRAGALGIERATVRNHWLKEALLHAAYRCAPSDSLNGLYTRLGDIWQSDVMRHWTPCDSVEAVIGGIADRVIAFARSRGARVLGHAVCAHPVVANGLIGQAYASLGLDPVRATLPGLDRRLAEIAACDRMIVDSSFVVRSFEAQGVAPDRIIVATPGLDRARFRPRQSHERPDATFRVVCVGLITPRKGQQFLLDAWRMLKLPNAELVLVGIPGRDGAAVLQGFRESYTGTGHVPNAKLRDLLVRSSVFVAPSIEDGFNQAAVEAMACGLPVIATENVGMADLITDGSEGFVVPAFDAPAIAERLEELFMDRERAVAMGRAAADRVGRCASWASYVDRVLAEHRRLVSAPEQDARVAA
jgi:glycosyltransferase involved in cell wall biosynthesis